MQFQSTLPVGGATASSPTDPLILIVSIHAPRGGSDPGGGCYEQSYDRFNPRSPWGERRQTLITISNLARFNLRSPWGERHPRVQFVEGATWFQSTLPVGGATPSHSTCRPRQSVSIHAPRGGSDFSPRFRPIFSRWFQSTLPVGGATLLVMVWALSARCFNPRSPWGERLASTLTWGRSEWFQSTLPVGGATVRGSDGGGSHGVSIHAPRGGSDRTAPAPTGLCHSFNPRSPWGERPRDCTFCTRPGSFNPRSPWGERLSIPIVECPSFAVSIHAPRGGSD